MITCPNPNSPEYINLVKLYGEGVSQVIYHNFNLNRTFNQSVPNLIEASKIYEDLSKTMDLDELFNVSNLTNKVNRASDQLIMLENLKNKLLVDKKLNIQNSPVINSLIKMTEDYLNYLDTYIEDKINNKPVLDSISVSTYMGSGDFKDSNLYINFKRFGIFIHEVFEKIQKDANENKKSVNEIFTRDYFDSIYNEYIENNPFNIEGFTVDAMFSVSNDLISTIKSEEDFGSIILPELTLFGFNKKGTPILGRSDLLVIKPNGSVIIMDFKTKKTYDLYVPDSQGILQENSSNVLKALNKNSNRINIKQNTGDEFRKLPTRSTFDIWNIQTRIYQNLLSNYGIKVSERIIPAILYQTTKEGVYIGHIFKKFSHYDFESIALQLIFNDDSGVSEVEIRKSLAEHIKNIYSIVDKEIPISKEESETREKDFKFLDFTPTKEDNDRVIFLLKNIVESNLSKVKTQINDTPDEEKKKILNKELQTLENFQNIINRTLKEGGDTSIFYSANYSFIIETLDIEFINLSKISDESIINFRNLQDYSGKDVKNLYYSFIKSVDYSELLDVIKEIASKRIDLNNNSNIMSRLGNLEGYVNRITSNFREVGIKSGIQILRVAGESVKVKGVETNRFRLLKDKAESVYKPEIEYLKKEIERLKDESSNPQLNGFKNSLLTLASKSFLNKLYDFNSGIDKNRLDKIKELSAKLVKLNTIINEGFEYSDESFEKYIKAITDDEDSNFYIGSQGFYNDSPWLKGVNLDSYIATASNSDMMTSAMMILLKKAGANARLNIQKDLKTSNLATLKDNLLQRYSLEEINDKISEWYQVEFFNYETKEIEKRDEIGFVTPWSNNYSNRFSNYKANLQKLYSERKQLLTIYYNTPTPVLKKQLDDKNLQINVLKNDFTKWLVENANLEYGDAFYDYLTKLPESYKTSIQSIYFEMEVLRQMSINGDVFDENEEIYDEYKMLEIELKRLKEDLIIINPEYGQIIDNYNNLFDYNKNSYDTDKYNRIRESMKIRYADNPELFEKWDSENSVSKPTPLFWEKFSEIMDEIASIYETYSFISGELNDLRQLKKEILAKYKLSGRLEPRYMSDDDVELIDQINSQILDLIEKNKINIPEEESEYLQSLYEELYTFVDPSKKLSSLYDKEFTKKYNNLLLKLNDRDEASQKYILSKNLGSKNLQDVFSDFTVKSKAFENAEIEFKKYYEKYHDNPYLSVSDSKVNYFDYRQPKSFLYEIIPTKEYQNNKDYYDTFPADKYKIRTIKEEFKNKDFQKSINGIPLPKGFKRNGNIVTVDFLDNPNINPKYKELVNNSDFLSLYNSITDTYFTWQNKMDGKISGYKLPGFTASSIENYSRYSLEEAAKKQFAAFVDKNISVESSQDSVDNQYGDLDSDLRLRYIKQLPKNLQSQDAVGSIIRYSAEANLRLNVQDVSPIVNTFIEYLKLTRKDLQQKALSNPKFEIRSKELDSVIKILDFEKDKFFYGKSESGDNRAVRKLVNNTLSWFSMVRIGFDVANQIKNYTSGSIQTFLSSDSSDNFSEEDLRYAYSKVYGLNGFIKQYYSSFHKISDQPKDVLLYLLFNPTQKEDDNWLREKGGSRQRKINSKLIDVKSLGYFMQDKGDTLIGLHVMYAVMHSYKYKTLNGEMISADECYFINNEGFLQIRNDVDYNEADELFLMNKIYSEIRRQQGNYATADKTEKEQHVEGKLLYFFRKYLIPLFLNRFGYLRPSLEDSNFHIGYINALFKAAKYFGTKDTLIHLILGSKMANILKTNDLEHISITNSNGVFNESVGDFWKKKVGHARKDMYTMIILSFLAYMLLLHVRRKDDDDEELSFLEGNAIRILWGTKNEVMSMMPIGPASDDYVRNFTTALPIVREGLIISKMGGHTFSTILALIMNGAEPPDEEDSQYYHDIWKKAFYQRKSGSYEKGDSKLVKDIIDLTGIKNFRDTFKPQNRIDIIKKNI